jgi:pseudaminic acid cytidylyltransferase
MNASTPQIESRPGSILPIAIIPARGGSKRIPRKNIRLFNGKPMIAHAIASLQEANLFENIYVSTDDEEIAKISERYGATVPFFRPDLLSGDTTGTAEVIRDFLVTLNIEPSRLVCCAYATNPFLSPENLNAAFNQISQSKIADYSCAISHYNYPVQRALKLDDHGLVQMAAPENLLRHSQTLPERWHDAGQFYFAKCETWISGKPMLMNTIGIEVDKWRCVDIDDEADWEKAEILQKIGNLYGEKPED